jgi:hypothetical protein
VLPFSLPLHAPKPPITDRHRRRLILFTAGLTPTLSRPILTSVRTPPLPYSSSLRRGKLPSTEAAERHDSGEPKPAMVARPWWTGMPLRSMAHGVGSQFFLLKNKSKIQLISEILAYSPLSFIEIGVSSFSLF